MLSNGTHDRGGKRILQVVAAIDIQSETPHVSVSCDQSEDGIIRLVPIPHDLVAQSQFLEVVEVGFQRQALMHSSNGEGRGVGCVLDDAVDLIPSEHGG